MEQVGYDYSDAADLRTGSMNGSAINLKTAKGLGLTISPSLLATAAAARYYSFPGDQP